jgi:prepilin-type N-terminal cleavage/methylation domain-containing protein
LLSRRAHAGFTLIELVLVLLIVGALAAIALPKFSNLANKARISQAQALGGSIATGTANNFTAKAAGSAAAVALNQTDVCSSAALSPFVEGGISATYMFVGAATCATTNATVVCSMLDTVDTSILVPIVVTCAR